MGKVVDYFDDDTRLEGIFFPYEGNKNAPVVLVVPTYAGRDQFTLDKAKSMNDLGYSGFAVDMYGEGKTGSSPEENIELMNDVLSDRPKLQKRMLSAIDAVRSETGVNNSKIASILQDALRQPCKLLQTFETNKNWDHADNMPPKRPSLLFPLLCFIDLISPK